MTTWVKADGETEIELNDETATIKYATELGWSPKDEGGPNEGTVEWYKAKLDELGVDHSAARKKDDFVALYEEATK